MIGTMLSTYEDGDIGGIGEKARAWVGAGGTNHVRRWI